MLLNKQLYVGAEDGGNPAVAITVSNFADRICRIAALAECVQLIYQV
jgi:hypothetical protein